MRRPGPDAQRHLPEISLGQCAGPAPMTEPLFEIALERPAHGPLSAKSLFLQLQAAMRDGRLPAGTRLPPTRLAKQVFGVSRNTAAAAFDMLLSEGLVVARQGSGTYVAGPAPPPPKRPAMPDDAAPPRLNPFWLRADTAAAMDFWQDNAGADAPPTHADFRPALVDSRLFPFAVFRRAITAQLRRLETRPPSLRSPQGNQGNYGLRGAIAGHIAVTRAVVAEPDDILVTAGAQQAFDLLARTLVTPGETVVALEDPGYPPMRVAFAAAGARLVPVNIDAEGLLVDQLPANANVICVCPSHQFPLGVAMSAPRRLALLAFARRAGAVVIEDDYDGEFRHDEQSLAALRTPQAEDIVFYVGTFSKCMLPSLRLGFIVAPRWAMRTLVAAKNCLDWHCPTPVQAGVARFIAEGSLTRHVRKMRRLYRQRRQFLLQNLRNDFTAWLEPIPSAYGMHIAASARVAIDLDATTRQLAASGVKLHALGRYYLGPVTRHGLVLGFGAADPPSLARGLASLHRALQGPR